MTRIQRIKELLAECTKDQREEIFRQLREQFAVHPLEVQLHTKAEIILEAVQRAGGITLRMLRGVLAEAAFDVEVIERLQSWTKEVRQGDLAFDFLLNDSSGQVRVQVKLQRSKQNRPMRAKEANRAYSIDMYVVETQKTRKGAQRSTGASTRPYRFGEFDILAVAMYPSTNRWDTFMYAPSRWLIPATARQSEISKFQPVSMQPNDDWTDNFSTAVSWFRSTQQKTIRS